MSEEAAFLREIQANPSDTTVKLVYADWLEEHDELERAKYVRLVAGKGCASGPPQAGYAPWSLRGAWLDLFHNCVPLWDPVTLLALGRLNGLLAAFAMCSDHAADIDYHFRGDLLRRCGSLQSMTNDWFGSDYQPMAYLVRHEQTQRRGAGKRADAVELDGLPADVLTPEFAAEVAEETERLLKMLDGDLSGKLREIAIWKMEGYSNEQIAARLGCVLPQVERKLRTIREIWGEEVPS